MSSTNYLIKLLISFIIISGTHTVFAEPFIKLTAEEKAFRDAHPTIRVANETDWPPFDFAIKNTPNGYSIDFLNLIAKKTGLNLEYINGYSWDELVGMGKEKKLDVFPAMWKTSEREQFFNFSAPYIDTPYILVVHQDEQWINKISHLNGRTLTGIKGFASTETVKKHYPNISIVEVDNAAAGLRQVAYKKASAYLGSMAETNFTIKSHLVPNLKIAGETDLGGRVKVPLLYIGIRKDWPLIASIINKGMDAISHNEKQQLQEKWLQFDRKTQRIALDETEIKFVQDTPVLRVAFSTDWPPVEYTGINNSMTGIAADYLKHISALTSIQIEPVAPRSRSDMLNGLRNGEIDFISAVSPTIRKREWMLFTEPYLSFPIVIATREDVPYIGDIKFVRDKLITVVDGYAPHELLSVNHPELKLMTTPGVKEGLLAVANNQAFAFVGSLATISHVIGREAITGLKVSGETQYSVSVSMATRKNDRVLHTILQKALYGITLEERNAIDRKWSRVTFEYRMDYSPLWKIAIVVLIIFALILYWNRRLYVMANELSTARDEAESANKTKSTFLANMSHELRTPLNSILGFSEIMANDNTLTTDQKENLITINNSGEHLLRLLNDILDMAKIESGHITLEKSVFDLHRMITEIKDMLVTLKSEKGLYLTLKIDESMPRYILSDKARLRQILVNLIGNAIKYTTTGGITVTAAEAAKPREGSDVFLEFQVKDTGTGINPYYEEKIFSPFFQVHTGKQSPEGTGLGLSICRTLVKKMGGDIRMKSLPGQGTLFVFDIRATVVSDLKQNQMDVSRNPLQYVARLAPDQPPYRVLVVDDIDANRKLLINILETVGFSVKGVDSAIKAYELLSSWKPHLIWMDMRMPDINGDEATRQIRNKGFHDIKIIGISASAFEENKNACLEAGCNDFVSKPVKKVVALGKMEEHLGVKYTYENGDTYSRNINGQVHPQPEDTEQLVKGLKELPQPLYSSLKNALLSFDYDGAISLTEQIRIINPSLADALSLRVTQYQFGELQSLFKNDGELTIKPDK